MLTSKDPLASMEQAYRAWPLAACKNATNGHDHFAVVAKARKQARPARGVLRGGPPEGTIEHRRLLPSSTLLAEHVAHFLWVAWDLRRPHLAETAPHPTVHLIFEPRLGKAEVAGPSSKRFSRTLEGKGQVLGVKFRPAAFALPSGAPLALLRDRTLAAAELFGPKVCELVRAPWNPDRIEAQLERLESWLRPLLSPLGSEAQEVRDLVERIELDRTIVRVESAASAAGLAPRTLERRFRQYVGVPPKWVIRRYRLIEAAETLKADACPSLAELAAQLGYFDQSHFVRDFKALTGRTPSEFSNAENAGLAPRAKRSGVR